MYYDKEILPLDDSGHFLVAIRFAEHKIGGECSRESNHAYFAYGHIDTCHSLTNITEKCCMTRPASEAEQQRLLQTADVQKNMVEDNSAAWLYAYQAELATKEALFVPRVALTSHTGRLVVGMECDRGDYLPHAVQRVIDVFKDTVEEREETQWPQAQALASPKALSADGASVICLDTSHSTEPCLIEQRLSDRKILASHRQLYPVFEFVALENYWVAVNDEVLYTFEYGSNREIHKFDIPKNALAWTAAAARKSDWVAFSGDKGLVAVVNTLTGDAKRYYPHRGCKRDDVATLSLSDDGCWLTSKLLNKPELMLTDLESGASWQVAELCDRVIVERESGKHRTESLIPAAFAFIGSRLLVSENEGVREISLDAPDTENVFVSEQGKPGARVPLTLNPRATLKKLIDKAGLQRLADPIQYFHYPAAKLKSEKTKKSGWAMPDQRGAPPLGVSRLGGWPDLPDGTAWPTWEGRPMGFIGQINLSELASVQPDIRLPTGGIVLFFLGCSEETFSSEHLDKETYLLDILLGSRPEHKDGWQAIYADPETTLARTEYTGKIAPELFAPCLVRIVKGGLPLPNEMTAAYSSLDFETDEREHFNEVLDAISEEEPDNQVSGYPALLQYMPPEFFCTLAAQGKDPYAYPKEGTPEYHDLLEAASKMGLLVQFTSDVNAGFLWGDGGHLYFYGDRAEMEQGNFENCWVYYEN
ncbi:DUF1963 domain-containing protein [Pseudomaricurvus alkylphenolicus]|uniref:DUF1963 domain-containing protein n=1 Tax=Pseudomaricurvus alkylphenolicus TaxID=1306991 RepID=UPI0014235D4E|nr:DUF1963 domain-containing protein [Pseudomaricurvus alkylphenolicus]